MTKGRSTSKSASAKLATKSTKATKSVAKATKSASTTKVSRSRRNLTRYTKSAITGRQRGTRQSGGDDTGLDQLRPTVRDARDATYFRRINAAREGLAAAETELRAAVQAARAAGDSWTVIGAALDTTRQAAFQRFGGKSS